MSGNREIERVLAAARAALDELEGATVSGRPPSGGVLARVLRALLAGQIALLEAAAGEAAAAREAGRSPAGGDAAGANKPIPPEVLEDDLPIAPARAPRPGRLRPPLERFEEAVRPDDDDDEGGVAAGDLDVLAPARPRPAGPRWPPPEPLVPLGGPGRGAAPRGAGGGAPFPPASESAEAAALAAFPIDEINRWLASGTIFQIRGALAFLNLRSMGGLRVDELRGHIRRMGFDDEVGRLVSPGIEGDVLLFRRVEGP